MLKLVAILVILSIAYDSTTAAIADTTTSEPASKYVRGCYFTNWSQYRQGRAKYLPEDYIPGLCTHIMYAFAGLYDNFTVMAGDQTDLPTDYAGEGMYARVNALKLKDPNLKTILSIGGWGFGTKPFEEMSENEERRAIFVKSAIEFARKYGFDGIDIDWEYPVGLVEIDNYSALLRELRAGFENESAITGKARLLLTVAVAGIQTNIDNGYDAASMAPSIDYLYLMSYDFHSSWEMITGIHSPLYARKDDVQIHLNTNYSANYWNKLGIPKEKLIIGLGTYGRGWTLSNDHINGIGAAANSISKVTTYLAEAGVGAYFEFCEMLATGATRVFDSESGNPYLFKGDQWFGYDDVQSIAGKCQYIKDSGFGGGFFWSLDMDDFNGRCSNAAGKKYPLIGTVAAELGGIII